LEDSAAGSISIFTLKKEAVRSSDKPISYITTRRHNPQDFDLKLHRRANFVSRKQTLISQNIYAVREDKL
jgi:hypothetical protein